MLNPNTTTTTSRKVHRCCYLTAGNVLTSILGLESMNSDAGTAGVDPSPPSPQLATSPIIQSPLFRVDSSSGLIQESPAEPEQPRPKFWERYDKLSDKHDMDMLGRLNGNLDVLLIFVSTLLNHSSFRIQVLSTEHCCF